MFPIYDDENKIAIWWSAKCGCSTIKNIYYNIIKNKNISHVHFEYQCFDSNKLDYENILIIRDPYDRAVSVFMDKYINGDCTYLIENIDDLTFEKFVLLLEKKYIIYNENSTNIFLDSHHITPQFSEQYNNLSKYCIENNIDFKFDKIYKLEEFNNIM